MIIPDEFLLATRMSESELKQEIAVMLFAQNKLSLGKASELAEVNRFQFQHLLASRLIPLHYDVKDLEEALKNLRQMGKQGETAN